MKLNANKREETGKAVGRLRRAGQVPAVVYGHHAAPTPLAFDRREFEQVFKRSGHTQLVDLAVDGARSHKVLIKEIQTHPRIQGPVHVDLLQVSMREKLQVQVPVVLSGQSPVVERGEADLLHVLHQVRVECLPSDIPEAFAVDVSALREIGDQLRVSDLPPVANVTILDDPEETVVKAQARREVEEEEAAEAAEGEAAAEAEEEGEARAEGAGAAASEQEASEES